MAVHRVTLSQFARVCVTLEPRLRAGMVEGLRSAALRHQGLIVEEIQNASPHPAVDTGALQQSVTTVNVPDGSIVQVTAPHAGPIDQGTRPFRPPIAPLAEWAKRKGLAGTDAEARSVAFAISRSFEQRGIAPRNFMGKAWARLGPILSREISLSLGRVAARGP